jgi:hypothetical protein
MYNLNGQELRDLSILESKFLDSDGEVKNIVTLEDYFKLMSKSKKQSKNTYDEIVAHLCSPNIEEFIK